jgi:hypothetical protein
MGKYKTFGSRFDRVHRNDLNANFAAVEADINAQKTRVNDLIVGTPQPSEVVDARGGFPVLSGRLNDLSSSLAQIATDGKKVGIVGDGIADDTTAFKNAVSVKDALINISNLKIKLTSEVRFAKGVTLYSNNKTQIILSGASHHGIILHRNMNIVGQLEVFCNPDFNGHAVRMDNYDIYNGLWGTTVDDYGYSTKTNFSNLRIVRADKPTVANENFCAIALVADSALRDSGNGDSGFFGAMFSNIHIVNIPTGIRLQLIGSSTWINSNTFNNILIDSPINAIITDSGTGINTFKNVIVQTSTHTLDVLKDSGNNIIEYTTWDTHNGVNADDTGVQQGFTKFGSSSDVHRHLYSAWVTVDANKYTKLGSLNIGNQLRQQYVRFRLSNAYAYAEFLLYWDGTKFNLVKVLHDSTGERFRNDFHIYYKLVRGTYILYVHNTFVTAIGNIYNFTLLDGGNFLLDSASGGVTFDVLPGSTQATESIQDRFTPQHTTVSDGAPTYQSGYSAGAIVNQLRKNNKVVSVIIGVQNATTFTNGTQAFVASLPAGFRPKTTFASHCSFSVSEYDYDTMGYLYINSLGEISVKVKADNMKFAHIAVSFIVD